MNESKKERNKERKNQNLSPKYTFHKLKITKCWDFTVARLFVSIASYRQRWPLLREIMRITFVSHICCVSFLLLQSLEFVEHRI